MKIAQNQKLNEMAYFYRKWEAKQIPRMPVRPVVSRAEGMVRLADMCRQTLQCMTLCQTATGEERDSHLHQAMDDVRVMYVLIKDTELHDE